MNFLPERSKVVLRHLLERHASEHPNEDYVLFEDVKRWTYGESLQEAYRAANVLSGLGTKRGENILIFLPNGLEWLLAWWGVTFLGGVIVPINPAYKGEMLRHICQDSQATKVITFPDPAERIKDLGLDLTIIDPSLLTEGSSDAPDLERPIEPWDIHEIVYTSGTTGPSKGVLTPYFRTYHSADSLWGDTATSDDTFLVDSPLFHISGTLMAYPLASGCKKIALRRVFSGSRYWDIVREFGVTIAMMIGTVPAFLEKMPPQPNDADNPLRAAHVAPLPRDPAAFMTRFGMEKIISTYGMTEISTVTKATITPDVTINPKTCGKVTPHHELRLVDDYDIPVPTGDVGELIVRSDLPWMMNAGYWQRPEETAEAWRNGWFHTGDFFVCDEGGYFYYVDRKKDSLRRRVENISTFEVEREVMAYPEVFEAACVAAQDEFGGEEVKVFVVPREGSTFDPADLIKFLIPRMPYFMLPRYIEVVPDLPKTPTMRVKKYELREKGNTDATWDREAAGITVKRDS